jgi:predicted Rossmann-fold nucleotide-binding protein
MKPFPVVLVGSTYWTGLIEWMKTNLLDPARIDKDDLDIFRIMDDPQEIVEYIRKFVIL